MGNPRTFRLEAAGWGFWLISTLVLAGPCVYVAYQVTQEHLSREIPFAIGILCATFLAAVVTFLANTVIQKAHARRKNMERKQAKPQNKKR
jgi:hypothetical protein